LLGGSVAWAARERRVAGEVVGCGRHGDSLRSALAKGLVDRIALEPAAAVEGADLVVLATPVGAMPERLRAASPGLRAGALVTDVGSVKAPLAETLPGLLPPGAVYVGAHPMAGSHERGADHARADLFEGAVCVVTETPSVPAAALARVESFWRALGARTVRRDPAAHDREVAWMSHVPHAVAFAFARALGEAPDGAREVAGPGFRDFTRIARSDPELWAEILVANGKALAGPLARVGERLSELARAVEAGDADAATRLLGEARTNLDISPDPGAKTRKSGRA
jgi:prephenate dehydrogenase